MSTTSLESRLRDVLARQAAELQPPDVRPDDTLVVVGAPRGDGRPRARILLAAAAAVLLIVGVVAIANRDTGADVGAGSESPGGFHVATPQVQLDADSVEVAAGGRTFVPPPTVAVNSDPGTWNEYTSLELEWDAQGVPMRIYIYFASDGTDWWATGINTYDGSPTGEWIEQSGEYFRSALGSAYHGDLDLPSLHIHGLTLEAFRRPDACTNPARPLALIANYAKIDIQAGGGYGASVTLIDTATCTPVSIDGVTTSISSDNPDVASIQSEPQFPDMPVGVIRIGLQMPTAGTATIHVSVSDKTTGELIDEVAIPVTVR